MSKGSPKRAPIRVLHSVDSVRLEDVLLEAVAGRARGGLDDAILILVPTTRLGRHVKRRIAERLGAALGVHVLTHRALAAEAMAFALEVPPRVLGDGALLAIVDGIVEAARGDEWAHLREFPGARAALLGTLKDLRDAGLGARDLRPEAKDDKGLRIVADAYERFSAALEGLTGAGLSDAAGLVRVALPHIPRYLERKGIRRVFHHGAYELVGVHVELLESVATAAETTFLLPGEMGEPAFGFSARFARFLEGRGARVEAAQGGGDAVRAAWADRLRKLHDAEAVLPALEAGKGPSLELMSTQGAESELRVAATRALALHARDGVPLHEIAIVARSLELYAPFLEPVLDSIGLPFTSSASLPLAREPWTGRFLALLGVLAGEFERRAVIDLLRRGRVHLESVPLERRRADLWDSWSRRGRVTSGLAAWRSLEGFAESLARGREDDDGDPKERKKASEERKRCAVDLVSILEELDAERARWSEARSLAEHAAFLRDLAARRFPERGGDQQGPEGVVRLLAEVQSAASARDVAARMLARSAQRDIGVQEVAALARAAGESLTTEVHGDDNGGVRVLDVMQARGLTFRAVLWIGFQDGLYPRRPRADTYLPDEARAAVAERTGKRLAKKQDGADEEKLLLATTLSGAGERIVISFQRADDDGKTVGRSSALREIARAFTGRPDAGTLLADEDANPRKPDMVPAHPAQQGLHLASAQGLRLLPASSAVLVAAAAAPPGRGVSAARAVLNAIHVQDGVRTASLDCVEAIESFDPRDARFDGAVRVGVDPSHARSPTAIERLARCPQAFFLRDVLGIHALEDEVEAHELEQNAMGNAVHEALAGLYRELAERKLLVNDGACKARAHVKERLPDIWRAAVRRTAGPSYDRLPVLFGLVEERWLGALTAFIDADLEEVLAAGSPELRAETCIEGPLALPGKLELRIRGYADRVLDFGKDLWLDDFKTSKSLKKRLEAKAILRGRDLQLPLYLEVALGMEGWIAHKGKARLLEVRPDGEPSERAAELEDYEHLRAGMLETVAVAWKLALAGRFPLHPEGDGNRSSYCKYCDFLRTCRKTHEPTLERLQSAAELADFRDVWEKNSTKSSPFPTLEAVRNARIKKAADGGSK